MCTKTKEHVQALLELNSDLYDACIEKSIGGGLGGCREFDMSNYPPKHREYIRRYLDEECCSVQATYEYTLHLLGLDHEDTQER